MGDEITEQPEEQRLEFSLRQNDIRALICFAATGTIAANMEWAENTLFDNLVICSVVIYTLISYIWLKKHSRAENQQTLLNNVMTVDAAVIGVVLSLSGFGLLPSILFITMVQFNSLINGGIKKWGRDNLALLGGVAFTFLFQQPKWMFSNKLEISAVSLIGTFTYFCAYALYAHNRIYKLDIQNKKLINEQVLYKLRSYKLSRYLTPTVWKAVNEGREASLGAERKRVTIFFSDILGFSSLSEEIEAEALTDLLNNYLTEMAQIAIRHEGTIDKFIGDAIMIIFGDNQSKGLKDDGIRCISMALEMRVKMKELQTKWYNQGIKKPLQIRMGVNTGYCTVGSFGTSHYMDYTALGTHVNLASRLETAAKPGEILISHETWSLIKDVIMCRDKGEIKVKGFHHPIKVYQVVDFRKNLGKNQGYFEQNTQGFSMHLDFDKLRNYDKTRIIDYLENLTEKLREKM